MKREQQRKLVSFEHNDLKFPSQPADSYRVRVNSDADGVLLWLESKKTKQQWQRNVTNVAEFGPVGLPEDAVLTLLERAFDNISEDGGETKLDVNDPTLVMSMKDGEMVLTLTLSLGGVWKPEFVFTLLPVGLEKVDVLEAKLRDAQDEIELLRAQVEAAKQIFFFSATPTASCTPGQHVVWSTPTELGTTHFAQSEDKKQVRILVAGVYQVNVRLGATNTTNGAQLGLQKNGADYANCSHSDTNGHYASFQISELMRLAVGDTLQVRWAGSGASFTAAGYTRFSIQYLGF